MDGPPAMLITDENKDNASTSIDKTIVNDRRQSSSTKKSLDLLPYNSRKDISISEEECDEGEYVERKQRIARITSIRKSRTFQHIEQFFRITVFVGNDKIKVEMTVDKHQTVEYLARQIEAEYAMRFNPEEEYVEIGMIHDSGMLPLKFNQIISDCLRSNDTVYAINNIEQIEEKTPSHAALAFISDQEVSKDTLDPEDNLSALLQPPKSQFLSGKRNKQRAMSFAVATTQTDRFETVLRNKIALRYFIEFCMDEFMVENLLFWLEVEIFQSTLPEHRIIHANYIVQLFLLDSSPFQINLPAEVRKEIEYPFRNAPGITMFDEAQYHISGIMRAHSYSRFEKSERFLNLVNCKNEEPEAYQKAKITAGFDSHFKINLELMESNIRLANNPVALQASRSIDSLNLLDNQELKIQNDLKETILFQILNEYFPLIRPNEGYFSQTKRLTWSAKQKKLSKAVKLHKFFGERPTEDQLKKQVIVTTLAESESSSIFNAALDPKSPDDDENTGETTNRRKKVEKLEGFFGDRLPSKQLRVQKLVNGEIMTDESEEIDAEYFSEDSASSSGDEILIPVETSNELDATQKRMLTKRSKKLQAMLGESLDEATVQKHMTERFMVRSGSASGINSPPENAGDDPQDMLTIEESKSDSDDDLLTNTKGKKKKQINKINKFLGERITPETLQVISAPATNLAKNAPRPLTNEERAAAKKRLNKLESILGVLPPGETVGPSAPMPIQKPAASSTRSLAGQAIHSLSTALQKRDVIDLLETFTTPDGSLVNRFCESGKFILTITQDNFNSSANKEVRQKKLKKLRKFFGDTIDIVNIFETQILQELESSLIEESDDPEEISLAREEMRSIRETLNRENEKLVQELSSQSPMTGVLTPNSKRKSSFVRSARSSTTQSYRRESSNLKEVLTRKDSQRNDGN
ncbi:hypothetical protein HK098_004190 [Nowakowskiella sp. JEL0407]|nr:hypothetical protein HK098_004190 [Nowakowskiella sp. JEL0407]